MATGLQIAIRACFFFIFFTCFFHNDSLFAFDKLIAKPEGALKLEQKNLQCPIELQTIDSFEQKLVQSHVFQNGSFNASSKDVKALKKAYDAFQTKKFLTALKWTEKIKKSPFFFDFAYWISGSSLEELAKKEFSQKKYLSSFLKGKRAILNFNAIYQKAPYSPLLKELPKQIAVLELLIGRAMWEHRHKKESLVFFETGFQRLFMHGLLPFVDARAVETYAKACQKKRSMFCEAWVQKLIKNVDHKTQESLAGYFPFTLEKMKNFRPLDRFYAIYKAPDLDQAAFDAAMKLYWAGNYGESSQAFSKILEDYPRTSYAQRVKYWLGQSFLKLSLEAEASKVFSGLQRDSPLSYYGLLASFITGQKIESFVDAQLPMVADLDSSLSPQEIYHLSRAKILIAEKMRQLAAFDLREIKPRENLSSPFLMSLAILNFHSQNDLMGFQILGELLQRGYQGALSSYALRLVFPVRFFEIIKKYASQVSLDPILILSLMKQESAFSEDISSSSGALGLMQLMFPTALEMDSHIAREDLLYAESNIQVGTKYLKKMVEKYKGNLFFALASYNAGPNAVDRWIKEMGKKTSFIDFIESIPYKETREYVGSIMRNYYWYSKQINGSFLEELNRFWIPQQ